MKLFLSAILSFIVHIFVVSAMDEFAPDENPCLMNDDKMAAIICVSSSGDMVQESSNYCLQDTNSCYSSLDCAMQEAQQEPQNATIICLNPGNYMLNVNVTFENFDSGISIIGNSTHIHCSPGIGLTFFNSSNILLSNLYFSGCGSIHDSINLNVTTSSSTNQTIPYHAGIYVSFCTNVTLRNVSLDGSRGIGLVLYDTVGLVNISECNFTFSKQYESYNLGGGGGMSIEFSYCIPSPTTCVYGIEERAKNYTSNSRKWCWYLACIERECYV
uniref:Right handed beta helix domain-containing protein n=1 Tax=Amphimedon queenslandica TaxID=400682 RepID=A0A1X7SWL6_AMPQE